MVKISKKIAIFAIVVTMLVGMFALTACNIGGLSLEQRIDVAGQSAHTMQNGGNPTTADIDELLAELATLRAEVERLQGENAALLVRIDGYQAQLKALRDNNGGNGMRHPNSDKTIDVRLENQIRGDFLSDWLDNDYELGTTIDEVFILKYYGTYGEFVVVEIIVQGWTNSPTGSIQFAVENFNFSTIAFFTVWNEGTFYTLQNAFNLRHLTLQNIETIYKIHTGV